jgi:hypothetical protein
VVVFAIFCAGIAPAFAQSDADQSLIEQAAQAVPSLQNARTVNDNSVQVIFNFEDYYRRLIDDMGRALQTNTSVRVVPVIGVSHLQSVYDQLHLKGIDLSIIHSDVLEYLARTQNYDRVFTHINSLGTLYREKIAVIAGGKYKSLDELSGQKVNFGKIGGGADLAGTLIFDTLEINVEPVRFDKFEAIDKVKSGELAATLFLLEDAPAQLQALSPEENATILPIPNTEELLGIYSPETFDSSEFPLIINKGDTVTTLSASVIIASYNWPDEDNWRYKKLARFVNGLIANMNVLESGDGYEEIWQHISFDADVPGVQRLPMIEDLLDRQEVEKKLLTDQERAAEVQQIVEAQSTLIERLNRRIQETEDPEELEALLTQMQELMAEIE